MVTGWNIGQLEGMLGMLGRLGLRGFGLGGFRWLIGVQGTKWDGFGWVQDIC